MTSDFASRLKDIEDDWQERWADDDVHRAEQDDEKAYVLDMFPYTSGKLHMGHARAFSIGDAVTRFEAMQGKSVLHPMGWDAFGMPAENAAIKRDTTPQEWTWQCIDDMRGGFKRLGFALDWSREITTCEPEYYKWDQWLFNRFYDDGLAYQDEAAVNWCPSCETVLANEQVEDGLCWRCDGPVETRDMEQWKLGLTEYADELLDDLDQLGGWPEKVTKMQRDWIGRSDGATITFDVDGEDVEVFTTRPDTLFGATFLAVAPEHPVAAAAAERDDDIARYVVEAKQRDPEHREKRATSGRRTMFEATHPFLDESIPVFVAEFVLDEYGTGAIMSVPAHDERDYRFAAEHDLPVKPVVRPEGGHDYDESAYDGDGELVNSAFLNGLGVDEAVETMIERLDDHGSGVRDTQYRVHDWLISRQRYWGTPIPVIHCEDCGAVRVPDEDLPVELPDDVDFTGEGNPLETSESFHDVNCPSCGKSARRETDTMDTFVNSAWYYLRYCSPDEDDAPFDTDAASYWMSVDQYVGGVEHAVMHLLYARFVFKFFRDQGMVDGDEPFANLLTQGMVNHPGYWCSEHGWLYPEQVDDGDTCSMCGRDLDVDMMKMSKSKNNVVTPVDLIEEHGADTARLFILSEAHPSKELEWSADGVDAAEDELHRLERLVAETDGLDQAVPAAVDGIEDRIVASRIQRGVERVTEHFEEQDFHYAATELRKLVTKLNWYRSRDPHRGVLAHGVRVAVRLYAPFAPHLADELWNRFDDGYLYNGMWPSVREGLVDEEAERVDAYFDRVAGDIRDIQDLVGGDVSEITVITAPSWLYDVFSLVEERLDQGDVGMITGQVVNEGYKDRASTVNDVVVRAVQNPGKFTEQFLAEDDESAALELNVERFEEAFDASVTVVGAESCEHEKAGRAEPGKPAIVVE
jgi:leucyl-tRNA synthetase